MNIAVVHKRSVYELYTASPDAEVREFMRSDGERLKKIHDEHYQSLDLVKETLTLLGHPHQILTRTDVSKELISSKDLVITVGGDGTLLDMSHYTEGTPLLGVNSSESSVGFFCHCSASGLKKVLEGEFPKTTLYRMKLSINDTPVEERVMNDVLFAHENPAAMTRYEVNGKRYLSSGLLLSTAAGSTAFMYNEGGSMLPLDSRLIEYTHRSLRNQEFGFAEQLEFRSLTREGRIWIDGEHVSYPVGLGDIVRVRMGSPITLICDLEKKRESL